LLRQTRPLLAAQVRKSAAENLYLALLTNGEAVPEGAEDEVNTLLTETVWCVRRNALQCNASWPSLRRVPCVFTCPH
jgi:hypothetical protein